MATYFISDLHLSSEHPHITKLFLKFLTTEAKEAEALYILGDLFAVWIGDDNPDPYFSLISEALANLNALGIPVYFMHGNRDFLIGKQFLEKSRSILLQDPSVIQLYNEPVLLTHGDLLCTLDTRYQRFRKLVRHPLIQKLFLSLPFSWRQRIAKAIRTQSSQRNKKQVETRYGDVALNTVYQFLRDHNTSILIHGHTHKAKIHHFDLDTKPAKRIVLGEWDTEGCALVYSPETAMLKPLS